MRFKGSQFAVLLILAGSMATPAQAQTTTGPASGPLETRCGKRYQVKAGINTAAYDPKRNRDVIRVSKWDQIASVRYPRTIRSDKDLPTLISPARRMGGAETTLYAIEGFVSCGSYGGRTGALSLVLEEDGPNSKNRSLIFGYPETSCTYGNPNFERLKDLDREMAPWLGTGGSGCGFIGHHVKIIGYGFWTDAGAQVPRTGSLVGRTVAVQIFPVLDIVVMDGPGGSEIAPDSRPDPDEAFIANLSVSARTKRSSISFRDSQRDGVWFPFGEGARNANPIPRAFDLLQRGNNPLKPSTGTSWGLLLEAASGKVLTPGGYANASQFPEDKKALMNFSGTANCGIPLRQTFSIGRQRWDCFDRSNNFQTLHLIEMQASFTQQCRSDDEQGFTNVTGRLTYIAPEQVPCRSAISTGSEVDDGGGGDDSDFFDDIGCPEGTDPADCPDPEPPFEPGPPPEDPPRIGIPGSVKANPLVLSNGESKTMRLTVVTSGDADVDLAAWSEPEGLKTSLSRTGIPLPGSGTMRLTITPPDDAPMGDYVVWVSATNVGLTATAPIRVSVRCDPPTILGIDQPRSEVVDHGGSVTLEAKPGGSGPFKYQWYEGYSGMTFNPIAGATGRTFTTPALNWSSDYWVRVTNACGSVDSNTANITVH